jgi:hypothetical protein
LQQVNVVTAHGLDQIQDEEEPKKLIPVEFTTAMADHMLHCLNNQCFNDAEYNDAEFFCKCS